MERGGSITVGLGLRVSGSFTVSVNLLFGSVSKSFGFNTSINAGTMNLTGLEVPDLKPLAKEGASETEAVLSVGELRSERTVAEDAVDETYTIYKVDNVYIIFAFGEEQEFEGLTKIIGYFDNGNDALILGNGFDGTVMDITFASGSNQLQIDEGNTLSGTVRGGSEDDTFTFGKGTYAIDLEGGAGSDSLVYNYTDSVDTASLTQSGTDYTLKTEGDSGLVFDTIEDLELNFGGSSDSVSFDMISNDLTTVVNLDAGNDTLTSANNFLGTINGGNGSDTLTLATSTHSYAIDAGQGDDTTTINFRTNNSSAAVSQGSGSQFTVTTPSYGVATIDALENLVLNLNSSNNTVVVNSLENTILDDVTLNLSSGGVDAITVHGKVSTNDDVTLTDTSSKTTINVTDRYNVNLTGGVRSQGDKVLVDLETGNNVLDASSISYDRYAFTFNADGGHDYIKGTQFDDVITANAGNNWVIAGAGNDQVVTTSGNDVILGDNGEIIGDILGVVTAVRTLNSGVGGNDTINAGEGDNVVVAGTGNDTVTTGAGSDDVFGDEAQLTYYASGIREDFITLNSGIGGNDTINAGNGENIVVGGTGADALTTTDGNDWLFGDEGHLTFYTDGSVEVLESLIGSEGVGAADTITAGTGNNIIFGGANNDTITTLAGRDLLFGDAGRVEIDDNETVRLLITTGSNIGGDDTINAGEGNNVVIAGTGNDTVTTGAGNDDVFGDEAQLTYYASGIREDFITLNSGIGGNDTINAGNGENIVVGGTGADALTTTDGNDWLFGDEGHLTFYTDGSVEVLESLIGSEGVGAADTITAGTGNNIIFGGANNDTITTLAGRDLLFGDAGRVEIDDNETVRLLVTTASNIGGDDTINAGEGDNVVIAGTGNDAVTTGAGSDDVFGDEASISYYESGLKETLTSLNSAIGGADIIDTGAGHDIVVGGTDNDTITLGAGEDIAYGDNAKFDYDHTITSYPKAESIDPEFGGNDTIDGGDDSDIIIGGFGSDLIRAGSGNDFIFGDFAAFTYEFWDIQPDSPELLARWVVRGFTGSVEWQDNRTFLELQSYFAIAEQWPDQNLYGDPKYDNPYAGADVIYGDDGDDFIKGQTGDDTIYGGNGNDSLWGNKGSDIIYGGDRSASTSAGDHVFLDIDDRFYYGNEGDYANSPLQLLRIYQAGSQLHEISSYFEELYHDEYQEFYDSNDFFNVQNLENTTLPVVVKDYLHNKLLSLSHSFSNDSYFSVDEIYFTFGDNEEIEILWYFV